MFEALLGGGGVSLPLQLTPGPSTLIGGTLTAGYYGLVTSSEFITGDALASYIGLTGGVSQNSSTDWMKFSLDSKTLYVSQKPVRNTVNWDMINKAGGWDGLKIVTIGGRNFKIRALKGTSKYGVSTGEFDGPATVGSEWNRLIYHVSGKPFNTASNTYASEGITEGDWAKYSEAQLGNSVTTGSYNLCPDPSSNNNGKGYYVCRGGSGTLDISFSGYHQYLHVNAKWGWRPCLELID